MNSLNKLYFEKLNEILTPNVLLTKLIKDKFIELGIDLTEHQIKNIESIIVRDELSDFQIKLSDEQENRLKALGARDEITLNFTENDINSITEKYKSVVDESLMSLIHEVAEMLFPVMMANRDDVLLQEKTDQKEFNKIHQAIWGKALDCLEMFISFNEHVGTELLNHFLELGEKENEHKAEILIRLHARSIQVSREILTLLRYGFAEGAYARWRTLYELSAITAFIAENDNELAERYLDYEVVETYKGALEYQNNCHRLNRDPIAPEDFGAMKKNYDDVISQYGKDFSKSYGWAEKAIRRKSQNENITFEKIEEAVGYDHFSPLYKRACSNIHAGPRGIVIRMGMHADEDFLISGPSIFDIYDPSFDTTFSLSLITSDILAFVESVDAIVYMMIIEKFRDEVIQVFGEVDENR